MAFCSSGLLKTFVVAFLLDLTRMYSVVCRAYAREDIGKEKRGGNEVGKMEKRSKTPGPSFRESLWTAGQEEEVRGRERVLFAKYSPWLPLKNSYRNLRYFWHVWC